MKYLFFILSCILILSACDGLEDEQLEIVGEDGELSVYIPPKYRDKGIEDSLKVYLSKPKPGLLYEDKFVDLKFIDNETMDGIIDRNVLEVNIDDKNEAKVFVKKKDLNAKEQLHMILYAKSVESAIQTAKSRAESIILGVDTEELERTKSEILKHNRGEITEAILLSQGVEITVPRTLYNFVYNQDDFAYIKGEQKKVGDMGKQLIQEFLWVMQFPDVGDSISFTRPAIQFQINNFFRQYVKYDANDSTVKSYLQISPEKVYPTYVRRGSINKVPVMDLRGNYGAYTSDMEALMFGGYYVARAYRDYNKNRIVVVMGAVNAPREFGYRQFLRKMEAVIATTKIK